MTFGGVRSSHPVAANYCLRYGGNTSCIEIETGDKTLTIDAGTGLYTAGKFLQQHAVTEIHLFISHTQWDHIQEFSYFGPLHQKSVRIVVYSLGRSTKSLKEIFFAQQDQAFYPDALDQSRAQLEFVELVDGQTVTLGNNSTTYKRLNHPEVTRGGLSGE